MEYKKGDPVWRKKVFDEKGYPMVFMQLMKPGYACNPQEFIEQKAFVSFYEGFLFIRHFSCERDFYVFRSHLDSTRFEPFNLFRKFRNHCYSTLFEPTDFSQSYV